MLWCIYKYSLISSTEISFFLPIFAMLADKIQTAMTNGVPMLWSVSSTVVSVSFMEMAEFRSWLNSGSLWTMENPFAVPVSSWEICKLGIEKRRRKMIFISFIAHIFLHRVDRERGLWLREHFTLHKLNYFQHTFFFASSFLFNFNSETFSLRFSTTQFQCCKMHKLESIQSEMYLRLTQMLTMSCKRNQPKMCICLCWKGGKMHVQMHLACWGKWDRMRNNCWEIKLKWHVFTRENN